MGEKTFSAKIGSPGKASGVLHFYQHPESKEMVESQIQPHAEKKLWQKARRLVTSELKREILYLNQKNSAEAEEAVSVIKTHLLALRDPVVLQEINYKILKERKSAWHAISEVFSELIHSLQKLPDLLFQEKARDVEDIKKRLLLRLEKDLPNYSKYTGSIVYAHSLLPGELITLSRAGVKGFILEQSSPTAHELIVGRALGLPLLYGIKGKLTPEWEGKLVFLDAFEGKVSFVDIIKDTKNYSLGKAIKTLPYQVKLYLNLAFPEELKKIDGFPVEGVGLFRSELYFLEKGAFPSFSEQKDLYLEVLSYFPKRYFYFRLFDLSQDKKFLFDEKIPLNLRSVRYFQKNPELLETQLKALALAHAKTKTKLVVLIPMVTFTEEIELVKKVMAKYFKEKVPISLMIEHPAACAMIPFWKNQVYSFHLGTNDLLQFNTATDRHSHLENELLYLIHPANLILLNNIVEAAGKKKIFHCGELVREKGFLSLLLAMGYRYFSVSPSQLALFTENLSHVFLRKAKNILGKLLKSPSQKEQQKLYQELIEG